MRILGFSLLSVLLLAGCVKDRTFGKLTGLTGTAQVFSVEHKNWSPVGTGSPIYTGDSIKTDKKSEAVITFSKGTITLSENTCAILSDTVTGGKRLLAVLDIKGEVLSNVKEQGTSYEVWTPTAVAHAEGTDFVVTFSPQPYTTNVRVLDGRVGVFNPFLPPAPPVYVSPGYYTTVSYNERPIAIRPISYRQFKKMKQLLEDDYPEYERKFRVQPDMDLDAPIMVSVPVMVSPPSPSDIQVVVTPFFLPPGPGMAVLPDRSFPCIPRGRVVVSGPGIPLPPEPRIMVPPLFAPPVPHGRVILPGPALPPPPMPHGRAIFPGPALPPPPPVMVPPTGNITVYGPKHVVIQEHDREGRGHKEHDREGRDHKGHGRGDKDHDRD